MTALSVLNTAIVVVRPSCDIAICVNSSVLNPISSVRYS